MISLVVVAHNAEHMLKARLSDFVRQFDDVTVVDDGSVDETAEYVTTHFDTCRLIQNPAYLGFARSVNRGVSLATHKWVLICDVDTDIGPIDNTALTTLLNQPKLGLITLTSKTFLINTAALLDINGLDPLFDPFDCLLDDLTDRLNANGYTATNSTCIPIISLTETPYIYAYFEPKLLQTFKKRNTLLLRWRRCRTWYQVVYAVLCALKPFFTLQIRQSRVVVLSLRALMR